MTTQDPGLDVAVGELRENLAERARLDGRYREMSAARQNLSHLSMALDANARYIADNSALPGLLDRLQAAEEALARVRALVDEWEVAHHSQAGADRPAIPCPGIRPHSRGDVRVPIGCRAVCPTSPRRHRRAHTVICANRADDTATLACTVDLGGGKAGCKCRLEVEALEKGQETRKARVPDSAREAS